MTREEVVSLHGAGFVKAVLDVLKSHPRELTDAVLSAPCNGGLPIVGSMHRTVRALGVDPSEADAMMEFFKK